MSVFLLLATGVLAQDELPLIVSELENPNDFELFANGGWTGNWYIGNNHAWISKLRAVPERNKYKKALIKILPEVL